MPIRGRRFKQHLVSKEMEGLIRTFPTAFVTVERASVTTSSLSDREKIFQTIWQGDALIKRVSSTAQRLNMGQIETRTRTILILGRHDFRIGDFVRMREVQKWATNHPVPIIDVMFQIQRVNEPFHAYTSLELNQYQQQDSK